MKRWIGAALVAGAIVLAGPAAISPATAASQAKAQTSAMREATELTRSMAERIQARPEAPIPIQGAAFALRQPLSTAISSAFDSAEQASESQHPPQNLDNAYAAKSPPSRPWNGPPCAP